MHASMHSCSYVYMCWHVCMYVCMYVCMDGLMDDWMDWMDGWIDGWMYVGTYVRMSVGNLKIKRRSLIQEQASSSDCGLFARFLCAARKPKTYGWWAFSLLYCMCMYVYIYIHTYAYIYTYIHMCMYVHHTLSQHMVYFEPC